MNYKNVLVGIFAILAAALILDLPLVGAVQINIMRPSGSNWVKHDDVTINPENFIGRSVSVENIGGVFWTNAKIIIDISNTTSADIEMAYVYVCKGNDPATCVDTESPDRYDIINNELSLELLWNDIREVTTSCSSGPSSCMETSNVFMLFKVNDNGKIVWVGIWNKLERRTYDFAEPYLYEYGLDEMNLNTGTSHLMLAKDFIENYLKVPFNPTWVSGAMFSGATTLYELSVSLSDLGSSSPNFDTSNYTGDGIESISTDYSFVFAETSYGITNPVTLNKNPGFTCGSYDCESDKGESSVTCCYDCGCADDYYCDGGIEGTCKRDDLISLILYGTPDTSIENCNEQHNVNITVEIDRAPSDATVTASSYMLEGDSSSISCQETYSNVYLCHVIVPAMPDCESGEYSIGPNYMEFTISYSDGTGSRTKDLSVQFPDIVVGSFTCGENGCETSLGENQQNCCYDCDCSSGYCDIENDAAPTTSQCKEHPSESTIQIKADPTHIYNHVSGDRIDLNVKIDDAPRSLSIMDDSCEMDCYYNCTASCDVSCSETASSDPDVFNATCALTFTIVNYDSETDYTIYPTLNMSVTYNDGPSETVIKDLSKTFSTISVGASWCGDGICTPGEDSFNCCYDCECPEGYYCNTADVGAPTQGDRCEEEADMRLVITSFETLKVDYPYESHDIRILVQVVGAPSSMTGEMYCSFGNTDDYCAMSCEKVSGNDSHVLDCNLTTPIIDYKTSELYDPIARRIVLGPGVMTYSANYNDGSGWSSMDMNTTFDNITINVKANCGAGPGYFGIEGEHCMPYDTTLACETDLDESYSTCCCDCPCETGKFCYISSNTDDGTCRSVNSVGISIVSFEPDPKKCMIQPPDKKTCVFYDSLEAVITITPTANYSLTSTSFKMGGEAVNAFCIPITETPPWNRYKCSAILPIIESETELHEGTVSENIMIYAAVQSLGLLDATISGSKNLQIKKEESEELKTIEEQIQDLEDIESSISSLKTWIWGIGIALVLACVAICIWAPNMCGECIAFDTCIFIDFIGTLVKIDKAIDLIKDYKELLADARLPIEINEELIDIKYELLEIMKTILQGVGCAMMFGSGIDSILGTGSASATGNMLFNAGDLKLDLSLNKNSPWSGLFNIIQ